MRYGLTPVCWMCLSVTALTAAGCATLDPRTRTGSGDVVSKDVPVTSFSKVEVGNTFDVTVSIGPQERLTLHVDDNLVDDVDAGVSDGTLRVRLKQGTTVRNAKLRADITAPSVSDIALDGAASVRLADELAGRQLRLDSSGASRLDGTVRVDEADVEMSGASDMKLTGSAGRLAVHESGASELDARHLQARDADIELSGASSARVSATGTISADLSGASELRYRGSPEFVRRTVSGGSSIAPDA